MNNEMTESEMLKQGLLLTQRLKDNRLDKESIFARLDKHGIPEKIARKAIENVYLEKENVDRFENISNIYQDALLRIVLGLILALLFWVIFPGQILLPLGTIGVGILSVFIERINRYDE